MFYLTGTQLLFNYFIILNNHRSSVIKCSVNAACVSMVSFSVPNSGTASLVFVWAWTRSFAHLYPNLIINECSVCVCVFRLGSMSVHLHTDGEFILTFQTGVHEKHAFHLTLVFFFFFLFSSCFFSCVQTVLLLFHLWRVNLEWVLSINLINQIPGEASAYCAEFYLFVCLF